MMAKWFHRSFLIDWGIIIALNIVILVIKYQADPHDRHLSKNDPSLSYPYTHNTMVSSTLLLIIVSIFTPLVILVYNVIVYHLRLPRKVSFGNEIHHAWLGLFWGVVCTQLTIDSIKFAVGRYRPDYFSRVDMDDSETEKNGRLSFPSGHSGLTFCAMMYLSSYFAGKFGVYRRGLESPPLWRHALVMSPLGISFFVAISRVIDYRHHFEDIIAGSVIGVGFALASYCSLYQPLTSRMCGIPKPRISFTGEYDADEGGYERSRRSSSHHSIAEEV